MDSLIQKVGWNNQPTKCPLLNPVRFSAYQMSITPQRTRAFLLLSPACVASYQPY